MKHIVNLLIAAYLVVFMAACATEGQVSGMKPDWIDRPGNGVSASAGMHVKGRVAQEELAILRGREEYAKRFGVNIQSEQISSSTVVNERLSTIGSKVTREDSKQSDIKVMVKEKWRDPDSDVLWVWLVPSVQ